jgi:cystathionine beta-synthase
MAIAELPLTEGESASMAADDDGEMQFFDNIIDTIGRTPLVRLASVTSDLPCTILVKIEFFNPGGSVKDRIGPAIIDDYEARGILQPGGTIVEATSGNTGVGLAMAAASKGYRCIFVMPDKMSQEKIQLLRAYGARVVVTPTAVEPEDPRSYYSVAQRLVEETPNAVLANQYHNMMNPEAHYQQMGPELWRQTAGRITHFVSGMGTGGTITGAGRFLKEQNPHIQVIGVDPVGSILYELHRSGRVVKAESYKTEGIGEDFLPSTLDLNVVDAVVQVDDRESFLMTRRLVREEGIFSGVSSGSAVQGAVKYAREHNLGLDDVMVVILPDSGSRYLSKAFNDDWMRENGFLERAWIDFRAVDIQLAKGEEDALILARPENLMTEIVGLMKQHSISQLPVVNEQQQLVGIVREIDLLKHMLTGGHRHEPDETIAAVIDHNVTVIQPNTPLETLMGIFSHRRSAIVTNNKREVQGIITQIDLLDFLAARVAGDDV